MKVKWMHSECSCIVLQVIRILVSDSQYQTINISTVIYVVDVTWNLLCNFTCVSAIHVMYALGGPKVRGSLWLTLSH